MLSELSESDRETLTKALVPLERLASSPAFSLHRPVLEQSYPFEPHFGRRRTLVDRRLMIWPGYA
jgi:hypothetical protein